jgi:hypothetical protein
MSGGPVCACQPGPNRRLSWRVLQRRSNRSAFNGYRQTPSAYSEVRCLACGAIWRTRAEYIDSLIDSSADDRGLVS